MVKGKVMGTKKAQTTRPRVKATARIFPNIRKTQTTPWPADRQIIMHQDVAPKDRELTQRLAWKKKIPYWFLQEVMETGRAHYPMVAKFIILMLVEK